MKIFIAGPREEKQLDENVYIKLNNICEKGHEILVGDAYGIDSAIQNFLFKSNYANVKVFASNGLARNNYGNWQIEKVLVSDNVKGFDFYVKKDLEMVKQTDIGFMIWNGKSRGTFNNIVNLLEYHKEVVLYYLKNKKFYHLKSTADLENFLNNNVKLNSKLKQIFPKIDYNQYTQMVLF